MTEIALANIIVSLLPTITTGITHLIEFVKSVRTAAQQTAAWTPEMESAFLAALKATTTDPAYQPDSVVEAAAPASAAPTPPAAG